MSNTELLHSIWRQLYPEKATSALDLFLENIKPSPKAGPRHTENGSWYKDAVVYSLYVDLFNNDFTGLILKLPYLHDLGVSCLWLLPILDSPMRDAGFDIRDYSKIRAELAGTDPRDVNEVFREFVIQAHAHGIRVIFDIALNHVSNEHPWFQSAQQSEDSPFREYFIWSKDTALYQEARVIFKGIESSNWEKSGDWYYFHRFFNFQPDLNYKNPEVLLTLCQTLLAWQSFGIDGFRADAIPYIWKKEGTECENLTETHLVVKFIRAILDRVQPGTLLLAEACQQPAKVVEYMGQGDECHAAYHFPLMPRIFKSIAQHSSKPIEETLQPSFTPPLPDQGQWFTFLRCHDELSLELVYVTEAERKYIHENYCRMPQWDFRQGEGISARLSELMDRDPRRILLAYSLILTLPGTPVIYYGDEVAKTNDDTYYQETIQLTGKDDTRFLVRGRMDWDEITSSLSNPESLSSQVYYPLKQMLALRNQDKAFGRASIKFIADGPSKPEALLLFERQLGNKKWLILHNLSDKPVTYNPGMAKTSNDVLGKPLQGILEPYGFRWIELM